MEKLCILIPSYNEARTIGSVISQLKPRALTMYVVDDGSSDDTAVIARREGAVVVQHKVNKGKGAAMREGFSHIIKKGYERVIVMDGDDQHSSKDLDALISAMNESGSDMVIGNRMHDTSAMPKMRIFVNHLMSFLISKVSGVNVPDTQCGFRIIKIKLLEEISLESSNYEIESELIIKAARKKFTISSCPIKTVYQNEQSRINPLVDTFRFIVFITKTIFK